VFKRHSVFLESFRRNFGEDINDASLNLGAGAFYYTENYYVAFQFQI
jgi:hypothetical protein